MRRLWRLWRFGRQDLHLLWFALRHRDRPLWLLPLTAVLIFCAIEPLNLAIPMLGIVDDFVILPMVLHACLKLLPADIRMDFYATVSGRLA